MRPGGCICHDAGIWDRLAPGGKHKCPIHGWVTKPGKPGPDAKFENVRLGPAKLGCICQEAISWRGVPKVEGINCPECGWVSWEDRPKGIRASGFRPFRVLDPSPLSQVLPNPFFQVARIPARMVRKFAFPTETWRRREPIKPGVRTVNGQRVVASASSKPRTNRAKAPSWEPQP